MQSLLKSYNKCALLNAIRNSEATYNIIRKQIKQDGFNIIQNSAWTKWYLVKTSLMHPDRPDQGYFNVYEQIGQHTSEEDLLKYYLKVSM